MKRLGYFKLATFASIFVVMMVLSNGCSGISQMGINLFSINIQVMGQGEKPLEGAVVSCSNGETLTVGADGLATFHFSGLGSYSISVRYRDNLVASYNISMPADKGKTLTANYTPPSMSGANNTAAMNSTGQQNEGMSASGSQGSEMSSSGGGGNYFAMMGSRVYPLLFQYVFNAYGYSIDLGSYSEGQYTNWQLNANGENKFMTRKAYLKKLPNGQQWWQVSFQAKNDSMLMEVLFSDKMESIRRMRTKIGSDAPKEVPVTEGWYNAPMQLTPESLEGSVVKKGVSVTVPAGTFSCDQLEFAVAGGLTLRLWRSQQVPGGVVKYEMSAGGDKSMYSAELQSYGGGAGTDLGSY